MRLLLDIDDRLFRDVRRLTRARKKKDAIVIPMREYLNAHKRQELADLIGNFDLGLSVKNLKKMRKQWQKS